MRNPAQIEAQYRKLEAEKAAWYQAHKDDDEVWGDVITHDVKARSLTTVYSLRIDPALIGRLRDLAEFYGCSTSDVARRLLSNAWRPAVQMHEWSSSDPKGDPE